MKQECFKVVNAKSMEKKFEKARLSLVPKIVGSTQANKDEQLIARTRMASQ